VSAKLKAGVEGDLRSLAVEIVDAIKGHTIEFSNQPGVHAHDYDIVESLLVERIGTRVKGRPRTPAELTPEERERFELLVGWAKERASVRLKSGTAAVLIGVTTQKAKVWYNAGHHTVPIDCVTGRMDGGRI